MAVELDSDSNGYIDIAKGGTNAGSAATARASLGVQDDVIVYLDDLSDLQAYTGDRTTVFVEGRTAAGDGYQGTFQYLAGNYSTQCTADTTYKGIYVPKSGVATTTGAWKRSFKGSVIPDWFISNTAPGTTDMVSAINAGFNLGYDVQMEKGRHYISAAIEIPVGLNLYGSGQNLEDTTGSAGTRVETDQAINMIEIIGTSTVSASQAERTSVKNLSLNAGDTAGSAGIKCWNFRRVTLEDVFIDDCETSIHAGRDTLSDVSYQLTLNRVHMANGTYGLSSTGSAGIVFVNATDCEIRQMSDDCVQGAFTGKWNGGFIGGNLGKGFDLSGSQNFTMNGFSMENCVQDIYADSTCQNINVIGVSTSNSNATYGRTVSIQLDSDGGIVTGCQVAASADDDAAFVGIQLDSSADGMAVLGNEFEGFTGTQERYSINSGALSLVYDDILNRWITNAAGKFEVLTGLQQILNFYRSGDTTSRWMVNSDGDIEWGDGSSSRDVKLERIAADILDLAAGDKHRADRYNLRTLTAAPSSPANGDIVYADGTTWDPGSGVGFYGYESGAWVKL